MSIPAEARRVTLFTRPGCHLCEEAAALMARLKRQYRLAIVERDVSQSPELEARYGLLVPVVRIEGGQELRAPIDEVRLRRALDSASRARGLADGPG